MPKTTLTPEALALVYLRTLRGWTQKELSSALGFSDVKLLSRYERGEKPLSRETLESLAAPLGYPPEALDALIVVYRLITPELPEESASPVALTQDERRRIADAALAAATAVAERLREQLSRDRRKQKAEAAREEASELWARMKDASWQERRELVEVFPVFQSWALVERVCHESERLAAHSAKEALKLAELALIIGERMPTEPVWHSRLLGYCWAHIGNARRVANDHPGAGEAFDRAWELWRLGSSTDPGVLQRWRILDLEASLRREQHQFMEALELLDRASSDVPGDAHALGRIMLKRANVFHQMGSAPDALTALAEAAPFIETSGDPRQLFALRFNVADNLFRLGQYDAAAELLVEVRELASGQASQLDLLRVLWLNARVAAGQGRKAEAVVSLEQVHREFSARDLPYDAAQAGLDLAVLWLEDGRVEDVKALALSMGWIFRAQGIAREALAALGLFCKAAGHRTATTEMAQRALMELERARRSASSFSLRGRV